jgi:hypothetical protein
MQRASRLWRHRVERTGIMPRTCIVHSAKLYWLPRSTWQVPLDSVRSRSQIREPIEQFSMYRLLPS